MSDLEILSKFTIGGQELSNRVVLAPMTRARCTPNSDAPFSFECSAPNDLHVEYYTQRASAGLVITEGTHFSEDGSGWLYAPHITTDEHVEAWKKVTDSVHAKNGKIYLQLWHLGRQCHTSLHPNTKRIVSASEIPMGGGNKTKTVTGEYSEPETPHALTIEEIQQTIKDFATGAMQAKKAGFDGVEIHSANGYLVDQFIQSSSNSRTDEYGGSMENRTRLLVEIFQAIVDSGAFPADRVGFRLSPNGAFGGMGSEDNFETFIHVAKTMNELKPAYLHLMDGLGFGFHNKCKVVRAADIRKVFDGPIIANVGLTKETAEGLVRSGAADLVAFGRPYIANPDLVERFQNNWPLAESTDQAHWWGHLGAEGYTDFPAYSE
ncbi:hypothetical protein MPSEU_000148300 [Mayamaea pseudoterrestris]|nr:hypothetical protein MPSEU_000148300 [Mayamaea pseudoterrestris]